VHEPNWFRWTRRIGLCLLVVFTLVPIYVMVSSAVKPLQDVQGVFTWWPSHFTLAPFSDMWTTIPLGRYFVNSLVVASASSLASVLIALLAAYSISRYRFRGRQTSGPDPHLHDVHFALRHLDACRIPRLDPA